MLRFPRMQRALTPRAGCPHFARSILLVLLWVAGFAGPLACGGPCRTAAEPAVVIDAERAVALLSKRRLEFESPSWRPASDPPQIDLSGLFAIPQETDIGRDLPRWFACADGRSGSLWMVRMDGLTGAARWYGPVTVLADGSFRLE